MNLAISTSGEALRDTFRAWHAERDVIDSQLSESLAALAAYQSHLDQWQQQLARDRDELAAAHDQLERNRVEAQSAQDQLERERNELRAAKERSASEWNELRGARGTIERERDELRAERNQLERDRAAVEQGHVTASSTLAAELNAARDKIGALTTSLLSRTEELRTLDNRRAEAATELELARARERELRAAMSELKRSSEQEKSHWTEELRQLHELLQRRVETPTAEERVAPAAEQPAATIRSQPANAAQTQSTTGGGGTHGIRRENPVLGSIVQQFDKLRQQRASDRNSGSKSR